MQVFHIKGFSGMVMLILAILGAILAAVILPATFLWVFWNATVFEAFDGPEIGLHQAMILWSAIVVLLKLTLNPQISMEFRRMSSSDFDQDSKK